MKINRWQNSKTRYIETKKANAWKQQKELEQIEWWEKTFGHQMQLRTWNFEFGSQNWFSGEIYSHDKLICTINLFSQKKFWSKIFFITMGKIFSKMQQTHQNVVFQWTKRSGCLVRFHQRRGIEGVGSFKQKSLAPLRGDGPINAKRWFWREETASWNQTNILKKM